MQEILFTQFHIVRNYNHGRSSDKIWAQEGRLFRQKVVIFPSFSSVIMNFFSPIGLISPIDPLPQKYQKNDTGSCQSTKIDILSVRSLKSSTATFSQIFSVSTIFFKILTAGSKVGIIPKSEGVSDVRD